MIVAHTGITQPDDRVQLEVRLASRGKEHLAVGLVVDGLFSPNRLGEQEDAIAVLFEPGYTLRLLKYIPGTTSSAPTRPTGAAQAPTQDLLNREPRI